MALDPQSRVWTIEINNPQKHGLNRATILEKLDTFKAAYYCLADEMSHTGTPHTHIYIYSQSPIRLSTLKRRFPTGHFEKSQGTAAENRSYMLKDGKWKDSDKADTSIPGSFYEKGILPTEGEEKNPKMYKLLQDIKSGMRATEIIDATPTFAFRLKYIEILRETYFAQQFRTQHRNLEVIYLYGATGTGKTRGIYANHPASEICRITDYNAKNGVRFDSYHGQDVLVFEEFNSQIPIEAMLNYLDVYPLMLPARYNDRIACYTKVYITSNIPLEEQYLATQHSRLETWNAFLRRISSVKEYRRDGTIVEVKK